MKQEQLDEILSNLDYDKIREYSIFSEGKIWIHRDGSISHVTSGTVPSPESDVIAILTCTGRGNIDESYYAEGWATLQDDGTYLTDDGRILSDDEMIEECLETGTFFEDDEAIRREIERQVLGCDL
ncbi:MAG: hypothetical protein WC440_00605 [Candidatus Omnitrophota bacterium]